MCGTYNFYLRAVQLSQLAHMPVTILLTNPAS